MAQPNLLPSAVRAATKPAKSPALAGEPIAIVGLACRFPGAAGPDAYWELLKSGATGVREVPPDRWNVDELYSADPTADGKMISRWGGFLDGLDLFDNAFFGISAKEAVRLDPQQRLMLEIAWEAFEDAGLPAERLAGSRTGVFVGSTGSEYSWPQSRDLRLVTAYSPTGSAQSIIANRLSYAFDLQGPSLTLDSACSSSLVTIALACRSIWTGESDMALAGGVAVVLSPGPTIGMSKLTALAPDGRCKAFDATANGYVRSEGAGAVVLKPLSAALADGDAIHAVVRGFAMNNDGRTNGLTAPSRAAQERLLADAYSCAGIQPHEVQYIEAHGTGTLLGDPIEAAALGAVVGANRERLGVAPCLLGSVKTNIGHLEGAAGIAGLIKACLMLEHRTIPRSLNFEKPNPYIPFEKLGLRVVAEGRPWPDVEHARAGVSAFGFGGTNCHVVLEEAPRSVAATTEPESQATHAELLLLSAKSEGALIDLARAYQARVARASQTTLASVCAAAATRRTHHDHRAFVVGENADVMGDRLNQLAAGGQNTLQFGRGQRTKSARAKTVFVYPGLGPQWLGMTKGLLAGESVFRDAIVRIDALVRAAASWSVLDELEGPSAGHGLETSHIEIIQTTLFAIQVALTDLWKSWGIVPDAVVGHSMGEVAAAHAASVLTLEDAVRVMLERSRLIHASSGRGAMASIELPLAESELLVRGREHEVSVAASNSPETTVLSGEAAALDDILVTLEARGVSHRRVRTTGVAGHGPQLEEARHTLAERLAGLAPGAATAAIYSTKTGQKEDGTRFDARYWGDQLREPVLFSRAVDALAAAGFSRFVELSPHPVLAEDIRRCFAAHAAEPSVMSSMRRNENERTVLLGSLGKLHALGHPVRLGKIFRTPPSPARLPTYPWQKQRFWLDVPRADENADSPAFALRDEATLERVRRDAWLYDIAWRALDVAPQVESSSRGGMEGSWLVLCDRDGLGGEVATRLEAHGARCVRVASDDDADETLRRVRATLERGIGDYRGIIHTWSLDARASQPPANAYAQTWRSLLAVAKACAQATSDRENGDGPRVWIATRGAVAVEGDRSAIRIEQSMAWGIGRVLANEMPTSWGGLVDLDPHASNETSADALVSAIVTGLSGPSAEDQLAIRTERWFGARLVREKLVDSNAIRAPIRRDAAYLVTGGLGALGLLIAQNLVDRGARRVILVGRTPLPDRAAWSALDEHSPAFDAVQAILAIERVGASVTTVALDVADGAAVEAFFARYRSEQRPIIAGVVHAAGVVRDQLLARISEAEFEDALAPKVAGAWNLHRALGDEPLDFFVLFSSAAGVLGSPGQANYAAANVLLDALATERARQGKAAQSLAWGPWADVGLARRPDRGGRLALRGITGFEPATGIAVFERLSRLGQKPTYTVLDASWPELFDAYDELATRALYRELRSEATVKKATTLVAPSVELLATKTPAERHDAIVGFLCALLGRSLGCAPEAVDVHKPLNRLGIDSLMVMELANRTKSALGVSPRLELFAVDTSTDELADHLLERLGLLDPRASHTDDAVPKAERWFFRPEPREDARARVFCFPYAGGGPWVFGALAKQLPSWIELVSVQLPGRGTRTGEDLVTSLDDAVPPLVEALAPWLDKPFALFGYSVGGLVAFETARALRYRGAPSPRAFVVAASRAPHLDDPFPELRSMSDEQFAGAIRSFGGTPEEALQNDELMAQVLPILRADFLLIKGYAHREGAPLDCPIEAFGGAHDSVVKPDDLDGWRRHSSRFDVQLFDEGHFFMKSREAEIAAALRRALESCAQDPNLSNEQGTHA